MRWEFRLESAPTIRAQKFARATNLSTLVVQSTKGYFCRASVTPVVIDETCFTQSPLWKHLHGIQTPKRSQESTTVVRPNMASRLLLHFERSLAKLPSISSLYLIHRRLAYAGAKAINSSKLEKQGYWDDAMKHLDEPIRWREQAFHWPRIILSFVIIYGAIALGIYATYRTYRYVTAASVDSR